MFSRAKLVWCNICRYYKLMVNPSSSRKGNGLSYVMKTAIIRRLSISFRYYVPLRNVCEKNLLIRPILRPSWWSSCDRQTDRQTYGQTFQIYNNTRKSSSTQKAYHLGPDLDSGVPSSQNGGGVPPHPDLRWGYPSWDGSKPSLSPSWPGMGVIAPPPLRSRCELTNWKQYLTPSFRCGR